MQITTGKKPLVSVIIDTYNYGRFVEEAIDSVLNQTFPPKDLEIIVVDDGSTDDTAQRIKKYKDKIKYIYKENGGQASAFNVGFENAHGEIIAFLDSDDYWVPHKLEVIVDRFERFESVDFVGHNLQFIDGRRNFIKLCFDSSGPDEHKKNFPDEYLKGKIPLTAPTSGIAVRARCLKNILPVPDDYRICADGYINFFMPFYAKEYLLIKEPLGYYRIHGDNLFENNQIKKLNTLINIFKLLINDMEKFGQNQGKDVSLLRKEMEWRLAQYKHKILGLGRESISLKFKLFFKTRYQIIKHEGLRSYLFSIYHYRRKQIINWAQKILSSLG